MLRLRYKSNTQDISFRVLLVFKVFQSVLSDSADISLHTEYQSQAWASCFASLLLYLANIFLISPMASPGFSPYIKQKKNIRSEPFTDKEIIIKHFLKMTGKTNLWTSLCAIHNGVASIYRKSVLHLEQPFAGVVIT